MRIKEIIETIEKFAPLEISKELIAHGDYDNSGFLVGDKNVETDGVVLAIDLSNDAVDLALEKGCNLVITHHPFIYAPVLSVTECDYKGRLARRLIQNGISLYSSHLPSDMCRGGIDDVFASLFNGSVEKKMLDEGNYSYGKLSKIPPETLGEIIKKQKKNFSFVHYLGDKNRRIEKVATFCGKASSKDVQFSIENGAELFVSCDVEHHHLVELSENGVAVLQLAHGESEFFCFKNVFEGIDLGVPKYICKTDFVLS